MGSVSAYSYLLPSTHQPINIKGIAGEQKYTSKLSQMSPEQLQSKQVNIHYVSAPREKVEACNFMYRLHRGGVGRVIAIRSARNTYPVSTCLRSVVRVMEIC